MCSQAALQNATAATAAAEERAQRAEEARSTAEADAAAAHELQAAMEAAQRDIAATRSQVAKVQVRALAGSFKKVVFVCACVVNVLCDL